MKKVLSVALILALALSLFAGCGKGDRLAELEAEGSVSAPAAVKEPEDQVSMLDLTGQQIIAALNAITVETLTPIEAMNELYKLKKMLE